VHKEILMHPA